MPRSSSSSLSRLFRDHGLVNAAFGVALAMIVAGTWIAWRATTRLATDRQSVLHTHEVLQQLDDVLLTLADAETGQRGYLLTNDEPYLEPYRAAVLRADSAVTTLDSLVGDNPAQVRRVAVLHATVGGKLEELDRTVELARGGGLSDAMAMVQADSGKHLMDSVRAVIAAMQVEEDSLLRQRNVAASESSRVAFACIALSGLLSLLLVALAYRMSRRGIAIERHAADVIADQKERLRTTLASIGDGVITTDDQGMITGMNPVAEELTRWTLDDARGRHIDEIFRIVDRYTRGPVPNPILRALSEGAIVGLANSVLLLARDGSERPMDDSAAPIRCIEGKIVGAVVVFRDVTERQKSRDRLREAHSRLQSAMAAGEIGTWELDVKSGSVRCDAHCHALLVEDATGEREYTTDDFISTLDGPERTQVKEAIARALVDGASFDLVMPRPGPAGRSIAVRGRVERDDNGSVARISAVIVDVTSQRRAEDRERELLEETARANAKLAATLSEADRRKDEFLATLAHELRNPLAPMRNGLEIMRLSRDPKTVEQARTVITRQLEQMVHLVEDLLDVSRISSGKLELRTAEVDLGDVLSDAVETSRPILLQKGHHLDLELPTSPVVVHADVTRLVQVFANLLNNAAKYSEPGSRIAMSTAVKDNGVTVTVSDHGMGIPPEMLNRVFDLFTQVDGTRERAQGGLGIGLTLVKRLVEMHGGAVEAQSDGEGKGSKFVVWLPH